MIFRYCAAVGRMAPLVGTKERIKFGHQFKEHRDIAVAIDPNERKLKSIFPWKRIFLIEYLR